MSSTILTTNFLFEFEYSNIQCRIAYHLGYMLRFVAVMVVDGTEHCEYKSSLPADVGGDQKNHPNDKINYKVCNTNQPFDLKDIFQTPNTNQK